ncbi:MAG TPA: NmrA family NAD(P)-binding protein, partial [Gemmatimonadaceae bacterium]|nr:NmrA family NAD(P)-binding protein [Gemmatimonadaceae bacterium]
VVAVSPLGRGTPWATHAGLVTASLAMDDLIASSGVSYRALTMPSFMDNLLRQIEPITKNGVFSLPIDGDRKLPSAAASDVARVAARLLLDHSWTGVASVPILGPEDLSYNDVARILSEVLGRPVRFEQISNDAFKARLIGRGMSDAMAQGNVDMWIDKGNGIDNAVTRTPESSTPTTFRDWASQVLRARVAP